MDHKIPLYFSNGAPRWQTVATTTSSRQSTAINARKVLITLTGDHHWLQFGTNPTANVASFAMPGSEAYIFETTPGWKVAGMTHQASDGTMTIVIMDQEK